jgi:hypothetical protein
MIEQLTTDPGIVGSNLATARQKGKRVYLLLYDKTYTSKMIYSIDPGTFSFFFKLNELSFLEFFPDSNMRPIL